MSPAYATTFTYGIDFIPLTHCFARDQDAILKMKFSVLFYLLVSSDLFIYNALGWIPQGLTDGKSTLVQAMAWCRQALTHLPLMPHIYATTNRVSIGWDNGLSPIRRPAITWTNAGLLSIGILGTHFGEIKIASHIFLFKKMHFNISSAKWRPFCPGGQYWASFMTPYDVTMPQLSSVGIRSSSGLAPKRRQA